MKHDLMFVRNIDLVIIAALIAISAAIYRLPHNYGTDVLIYTDGKLAYSLPLAANTEFSPLNGVVIAVHNKRAGFLTSICMDKTCVKTGFISRAGETAVCAPTRTVLTISGASADTDAVAK